jgi:hypothetical protein
VNVTESSIEFLPKVRYRIENGRTEAENIKEITLDAGRSPIGEAPAPDLTHRCPSFPFPVLVRPFFTPDCV